MAKTRFTRRIILLPILLLLISVAAIASHRLMTYHVFENIHQVNMSFENGRLDRDITQGDSYGILESTGPNLNLPAGKYRLKWSVFADGQNEFRLSFENGASIQPSVLIMPKGEEDGEFEFSVLEPGKNLKIETAFLEGTHFELLFLRLYTDRVINDYPWMLFVASLTLLVLILFFVQEKLTKQTAMQILLVLSAAVCWVSIPLTRNTVSFWEDDLVVQHLSNLDSMALLINETGIFRALFQIFTSGRPHLGLDVLLFPFAVMKFSGASTLLAYRSMVFFLHLFSTLIVYHLGRLFLKNHASSLVLSILITISPLRFLSIYRLGAWGEESAVLLGFILISAVCALMSRKKQAASCFLCVLSGLFSPFSALSGWLAMTVLQKKIHWILLGVLELLLIMLTAHAPLPGVMFFLEFILFVLLLVSCQKLGKYKNAEILAFIALSGMCILMMWMMDGYLVQKGLIWENDIYPQFISSFL